MLFQLEQQGFCCLYHNIPSSNYHCKIVTGGNQENIELTMSEIAKSQHHGILFSAVDGRFPVRGEVMPMTTYEKVALVLAFLQVLVAILALLK